MAGRKISDHSFFAGKNDATYGAPSKSGAKAIPSVSCSVLSTDDYPDTPERIAKMQGANAKKSKAYQAKMDERT